MFLRHVRSMTGQVNRDGARALHGFFTMSWDWSVRDQVVAYLKFQDLLGKQDSCFSF